MRIINRMLISEKVLITKFIEKSLKVSFVHINWGGYKMKKKMKKFTPVVAPVLAMSMALTACSGSSGGEKTTTTSNNGGEEKKSDIKYAAKQVLNRTETNEIRRWILPKIQIHLAHKF